MSFWLQNGVLAAKKCSQNANLQPERQFAAQTPIRSQNANLQPERQFNATRIFAAQTPVRCRLPVCSRNANLQPERQFAADLQPISCKFAAKTPTRCRLWFAAQTPICCQNANSLPVSSPNVSSLLIASLQP